MLEAMKTLPWLLLTLTAACARPVETPDVGAPVGSTGSLALRGGLAPGGERIDVVLADGRITSLAVDAPADTSVDVSGRTFAPGFIDSHVHLAFWTVGESLPATGVVGAVDLAAPEAWIGRDQGALRVVWAGPMVTAVSGYPTQSWGSGGYGIECEDADAAREAVRALHAAGARVIKVPVTDSNALDDSTLRAAVEEAHSLGLLAVSHAMGDEEALRAAEAGVDILAHTPTATLSDAAVAAWAGRGVISTLRAFGGGERAVDNLKRLHEAGATVLYGTDMGNSRTAAIDGSELALLASAGLSPQEILTAATSAPAATWGFEGLGGLSVGGAASFMLLDGDPLEDITRAASPAEVWIDGVRVTP